MRRGATRPRPSQAIIVLGAAQYNGTPSPVLAARLDHAIDLYREHIAPVIVVTGGQEPGDKFTEAGASADYLHASRCRRQRDPARDDGTYFMGVDRAAAARFLISRHMTRVVLVSDPYHSERIEAIAHEVGLDAGYVADAHQPDQRGCRVETDGRRDASASVPDASSVRTARPPPPGHEAGSGTRYTLTPPRSPCGRLRPHRVAGDTHSGVV